MRILLAEDDRDLNKALTWQLTGQGYNVDSCYDGEDALYYGKQNIYDVILLDRMLPFQEGTEVLSSLRRHGVTAPVILITALGALKDKILGLDLGADDYIAKPFRPRELISRIHNIMRRYGKANTLLEYRNLTADVSRGTVSKDGQELQLSALEYRLLLYFMNNKDIVLSRSRLLDALWDMAGEFVNDNTLTVYIKRLREKIEEDPQNPLLIKTIRGMGYKMGD